jgi:hypothetical protein
MSTATSLRLVFAWVETSGLGIDTKLQWVGTGSRVFMQSEASPKNANTDGTIA